MGRVVAALLVPCLLLGASGCGSVLEPDEEIYPIAIGYDKGENEKYRITLKFMTEDKASVGQQGQSQAAEQQPSMLPQDSMVLEAPSLSAGLQMASGLLSRRVSLLHIRLLVVSEELAREGVAELVVPIMRSNQFKPTMPLVISACSAFELVTSEDPSLAASPQADLELMLEAAKEHSNYLAITLAQFLYRYDSPYGDAMAIYGDMTLSSVTDKEEKERPEELFAQLDGQFEEGYLAGEMPVVGNREMELSGMALFRDEKMVGTLNTIETQTAALLGNALTDTDVLLRDPLQPEDYFVTVNLRRAGGFSVQADIDEEGRPVLQLLANYKGLVGLAQNPETDYISDPALRELLRLHCQEALQERAESLIDKLQGLSSDALQLGRHIAGEFATTAEFEAYDWAQRFEEAQISVEFSIQF